MWGMTAFHADHSVCSVLQKKAKVEKGASLWPLLFRQQRTVDRTQKNGEKKIKFRRYLKGKSNRFRD